MARAIRRADWRWDDQGHRDRWSHLFVVELAAIARPRQITFGDWGVSELAWSPDGRTVAFSADLGADADRRPRPSIWAVDVFDGPSGASKPRQIMAGGVINHSAYSPDGRWLAAIGVLAPDPLDDESPTVVIGPADGSRPAWVLAPELDRPIGNWADTDLNGWMVSGRPGPYWLNDGTVVTTMTDRGRSHPVCFELDPATGAARRVPEASARTAHGPWSDVTSHALGVGDDGRSPSSGRSGRARWS